MTLRPSLLCPVDFSEASRGALRFAAVIGEHLYADLTIVTVDDPLLRNAASARMGPAWMPAQTQEALEQFVRDTFRSGEPPLAAVHLETRVGKPGPEILQAALDRQVDLVVMSTHGTSGLRKLAFGSTTEGVLRQTRVPVLVTPANDPGPQSLEDVRSDVRTIVVPVDLSGATPLQVRIAGGLAEALEASVVLVHVIEPVRWREGHDSLLDDTNAEPRARARRELDALMAWLPPLVRAEPVLASGDPAEEIDRLTRLRTGGAIVMGLHSSLEGGPRMGAVTYRVLCRTQALVVALPPAVNEMTTRRLQLTQANTGAGV